MGQGRVLQEGRKSLCVSRLFYSMEMVLEEVCGLLYSITTGRGRKPPCTSPCCLKVPATLLNLFISSDSF